MKRSASYPSRRTLQRFRVDSKTSGKGTCNIDVTEGIHDEINDDNGNIEGGDENIEEEEDVTNDIVAPESIYEYNDINMNDDELIEQNNIAENEPEVPHDFDRLVHDLTFESTDSDEMAWLVLIYSLRHKLSNVAISHLLHLLKFAIPGKVVPSSFYSIRKMLLPDKDIQYDLSYYCNYCCTPLESDEHVCQTVNCEGTIKRNVGMFAHYHLQPMIQQLLDRESFRQLRSYKQTRLGNSSDDLEDVMDGQKWKSNNCLYDNPANLVLGISTDGVPLYTSSQRSVWPIWIVYYDIPPESRYKRHNMSLVGLSFGSKPIMNRFLAPLVKSVNDTHINPIPFVIGGVNTDCTLIIFNCVADLPAKASVLNMHQYNGQYGCPYCYHPGKSNGRGSARYYPNDREYAQRTHADFIRDGEEASADISCVHGIYGPTIISHLHYFELGVDVSAEYMHGISGTMHRLFNIWFNKSQHRQNWYLGRAIREIDRRLMNIRPPSWMQRAPRSIARTLAYWKAAEFVNFLLYHGPYVLCHILPDIYYNHFLLLHSSITIMLGRVIKSTDLDIAERQLAEFVDKFDKLYTPENCAPNVHYLLHYASSVRRHGPLWTCSMFPYENGNRSLKSLVHGQNETGKAMMNSVSLMIALHQRLSMCRVVSLDFYTAVNRIDPILSEDISHKIHDDTPVHVGDAHLSGLLRVVDNDEPCLKTFKLNFPNVHVQDVHYFKKITYKRQVWCCSPTVTHDNTVGCVMYEGLPRYAVMIRFARWQDHIIALVALLSHRPKPVWCPQTYLCFSSEASNLVIIPYTALMNTPVIIVERNIVYVINKNITK
eukprot:Pompholyxophrys_sp_v1_NODE_9_length_5690_cov_16.428039.p1 type:complete len:824 gc:universal NODE_9_length_5690_cov_16.428039:2580-109(-)